MELKSPCCNTSRVAGVRGESGCFDTSLMRYIRFLIVGRSDVLERTTYFVVQVYEYGWRFRRMQRADALHECTSQINDVRMTGR